MDRINFEEEFYSNLETLKELLSIPSIYDEKTVTETMPYGQNVYKAFDFMRKLAKEDGFIVREYANEAMSLSYVDKEDKRIDIASHLDVVSVDNSWSRNPFEPAIIDGKLYARGSSDMKTALFLTYLALKLLRKNYPETENEIRLVFGTDEERTMHDMWTYRSMVKEPLFAFSPDGTFPMCIGEKGALMWTLKGEYKGIIDKLDGGIQCNIVPPHCHVELENNLYTETFRKYFKENNVDGSVIEENGRTVLEVNGVAVHCSRNWEGKNATTIALRAIEEATGDSLSKNLADIFEDGYGSGLSLSKGKDPDTCLTVNPGVLKIEDGKVYAMVDARYPSTLTSKELTDSLKEKCILDVSLDYDDPPTLCNEEDPYVKTMLQEYRKVTDDYSKPMVSGGVSYSKVFKHCVTFGMSGHNEENRAHQKDEYVTIKECIEALEIYYRTMEKLAFLKEKI